MQTDTQLVMETRRAAQSSQSSTLKTILLHVQNAASLTQRLEAALSVARATSAHVSCLHVTPAEAYVAMDSFGGAFVMGDVLKALDEEEEHIRTRIETELRGEDVSWDYLPVRGNIAGGIISYAALADLVVTGRDPQEAGHGESALALLGNLLHHSRTPLLIPTEDGAFDPTGRALIAWDGGFEAANAVRSSLSLLKLASGVEVFQIAESKGEAFPSTRLLEYLSRHDIHAELRMGSADDQPDGQTVADRLIAEARAWDASYVVMGGYSHSRIREYFFGGVTRAMLSGSPLPLVIAH
jgi:nucleotide-binding universal stress UspA family protein